jgi:hypothetical protein
MVEIDQVVGGVGEEGVAFQRSGPLCGTERTRSREGRGLWGVRFVGSVGEALIDQG